MPSLNATHDAVRSRANRRARVAVSEQVRQAARAELSRELDLKKRIQDQQARGLMLRHFQSAEVDSRRSDWWTASLSGDAELLHRLPRMRDRARLMADNAPKAAGLVRKHVTNLIGPGVQVQAHAPLHVRERYRLDENAVNEITERAEAYFTERVAVRGNRDFDWRRMRTWFQLTRLRARHIAIEGGLFCRYRPVKGRSIPFHCQIVEPECIGTPPGKDGENVRSGVQFDPETGELQGFWMARKHPGDFYRRGSVEYEFVPAFNELGLPEMVFYFDPHRESACREIPPMQAVLALMDDVTDYKDSELKRKKAEADIGIFQTLKSPEDWAANITGDASFGQPVNGSSPEQQRRGEVVWPKVQHFLLEQGEDINVVDPSRPGSNYQPFLDSHDRDIGLGLGRSFERVSNNYGAANFSATRVSGVEDFVEDETDFALFAESALHADWTWAMWAASVAYGDALFRELQPQFQRYVKPSWDPLTDAEAATERIANGTSSLVEEASKVGHKWENVLKNKLKVLLAEREQRRAMGLPEAEADHDSLDAAVDEKVKKAVDKSKAEAAKKGDA